MVSKIDPNGQASAINGAINVCDVVVSTMGPHGRSVFLKGENYLYPSKDGVRVGQHVVVDGFEGIGADFAKQALRRTADEAGDATTCTAAILKGILENRPDIPRRELIEGLKAASEEACRQVDAASSVVEASDREMVLKIATTSANNNPVLGGMVADLVMETGKDGVIYIVDDFNAIETTTEVKEGYTWKNGVFSRHFCGERGLNIENPLILLSEGSINDQRDLRPVMEMMDKEHKGRWLVIICENIVGTALEMVVKNLLERRVNAIAVKAANFDILKDLEAITGAELFSEASGNPLSLMRKGGGKHFQKSKPIFGEALSIRTDISQTTISFDRSERLEGYISGLEDRARAAKLNSGIGYIHLAAPSEAERINIGQLLEDAEKAVFSALDEGCVIGGGSVLYSVKMPDTPSGKCLARALQYPFDILMKNSDLSASHVDGKVFNIKNMAHEGFSETTILDSTKALKNAIRNAVSVACEIIGGEYSIINEREDKKPA